MQPHSTTLDPFWRNPILPDRFWDKVDPNGCVPPHCRDLGSCWVWVGMHHSDGYGYFLTDGRHVRVLAHRVSYSVLVGQIPSGFAVCHHCDNPPCIRPTHLFAGSLGDNNTDRHNKGRTRANVGLTMARMPERRPRGERNGNAKLTEGMVRQIRSLHTEGVVSRTIASQLGVTKSSILSVIWGQTWRHVK